jgi:hypothetical protein
LGPTVYLNPLGPMDTDAPLLLKLMRKPGNRRTDLRNRNPITFSRLLGAMILAAPPQEHAALVHVAAVWSDMRMPG